MLRFIYLVNPKGCGPRFMLVQVQIYIVSKQTLVFNAKEKQLLNVSNIKVRFKL